MSLPSPEVLLMRPLVALWLCSVIPPFAAAQQAPSAPAESLFVAGRFEEAGEAFLARWAADSTDYGAALRLGTIALYGNRYHFLATLDYPKGELVLRRRTPAVRAQFEREAAAQNATAQPFWLAGDHFMFAWGRVNGRPPVLLFVDTGLAGGGFVCSGQAARDFGIDLSETQTATGVGGAGPTRVTWFSVDSLSMGTVTGRNIWGALGTLMFRASFGFDAGGIVSHQFFRPYALTFDFDAMRLYLAPGAP